MNQKQNNMTTAKQDREFAELVKKGFIEEIVISVASLDEAIHWIKKNIDPEEVFDVEQLDKWAENNGYKKGES